LKRCLFDKDGCNGANLMPRIINALPGHANDQRHGLRGSDGESALGVPQLSIQAFTSFQGTPLRVRSNSRGTVRLPMLAVIAP
jgi:hypothetical protein